jgi:large subunit ribosomal protein L31e
LEKEKEFIPRSLQSTEGTGEASSSKSSQEERLTSISADDKIKQKQKMADETKTKIEREYIIPLRKQWLKISRFRRAGRAAKTIKQFIAKHMKVADRDVENVKLDIYLNNELWFRGRDNPPARIKVKAVKEDGIVKVELAEMPQIVKFRKARNEKMHRVLEEKKEKEEVKPEAKPEETKKEEEHKQDEKEKEKSVEQEKLKEAKQDKNIQKHTMKGKEPEIHRRSMDRH